MLFQHPEIRERLPSDLHNFFDIDGIGSALPGLEGNLQKLHLLMVIHKIGRQHNIGKIEVSGHLLNILFHQFPLHEAEWCVGVLYLYSECHSQNQAQDILYKFP